MADESKVVNEHGDQGRQDLLDEAYGHLPPSDRPDTLSQSQPPYMTAMEREAVEAATRYNEGKPQLSYMLDAPVAFHGFCRVMEHGAQKYGRYNWQRGLDEDEIIDSLLRHLQARKRGEVFDPGSGLDHYYHVIWNAVVLAEQHGSKEGTTPPEYITE